MGKMGCTGSYHCRRRHLRLHCLVSTSPFCSFAYVDCILQILTPRVFCRCLSARYRRRNNRRPYYGTGWLAKPPAYDNAYPQQGGYYGGGGPAAPPYTAGPIPGQQTGNTFNSNEGYYGQQHGAYEMQPPQNVYYQGGPNQYHPTDSTPK